MSVAPLRILVLGGGPDAERDVSLQSSQGVRDALCAAGYDAHRRVIQGTGVADTLGPLPDGAWHAVVPVLHGPWGEGGPLQDLLEATGVAFVGCRGPAARVAMDKMATKLAAARTGVPTLPACVLNLRDRVSPVELPAVIKPIHEGSSVGVHVCTDLARWHAALDAVAQDCKAHPTRTYMVEQAALGATELTCGVLDGQALPLIHIQPGVEFYDYEAKYNRDDTRYVVDPPLDSALKRQIQAWAVAIAREIGVRHLCRVDFLLDRDGRPWLLEVNTMPGFTSHSLFPMAAKHAGLDFPALAQRPVSLALRDG